MYWGRPTATGEGFGIVESRGLRPPHSMVYLLLTECGWVGLGGYFLLLLFLSGIGTWNLNPRNLYLFLAVLAPIILITFESHSFFSKRYFAIYLVMLAYTTRIVMREPVKKR